MNILDDVVYEGRVYTIVAKRLTRASRLASNQSSMWIQYGIRRNNSLHAGVEPDFWVNGGLFTPDSEQGKRLIELRRQMDEVK